MPTPYFSTTGRVGVGISCCWAPAASGGARRPSGAPGARLGLVRPRPGPVRGTSGPRPDRRVRRTPGARFRTGPLQGPVRLQVLGLAKIFNR